MPRATGLLAVAALALLLGGTDPADAQTSKVGSFTKSTGGAPVSQVVPHGLGQTPKALILWTHRSSFGYGFLHAFGMTDGTNSRSVAMASQDDAGTSNTAQGVALKALSIVEWAAPATVLAEADLFSWDATNFTVRWTTNDATADTIHFIAIGGSGVSAKVLDWTMATTTGNKSVTGVGFTPDVVLHAHAGHNVVSTLPTPMLLANARFGLGVMDKAGNQWATDVGSSDNQAFSQTQRGQVTDACIYAFVPPGPYTVQKKASYVSMDADGFTVNFTDTTSVTASPVISLALKGVAAKAGSFLKSTTVPAAAYVQSRSQDFGTAASATISLPAASTTGNLVVVTVGYGNEAATVSSVVDNKGNTYRRAAGPSDWGVNTYRDYTYYAKNIAGGAGHQVTITLAGGNSGGVFVVFATEYRGLDTVDPLDQVSETAGTGNPASGGGVTTSYPDELLYAVCGNESGFTTVGAPFTAREWLLGDFSADRTVTSVGTYNVSATTGTDWGCQLLSFRLARGAQSITGVGFSPDAVLLTSVQDVTRAAPQPQNRLGLGAADGAFHQASIAHADADNLDFTSIWGTTSTTRAFIKADNDAGTIDAQAVLNGVGANGFTLDWTTNDAVATEILYLALGTPKPASYARFRSITVPTSSLGASCTASLSSFPMLVSLPNDQELRRVSDGGYVQNASGYDIVFTDAYNNPLDHEIEQYTSAPGGANLVAWVRLPTLSILGPTTIYMRYGNPSVSTPTANPAGVWDANYVGVWHLKETTGGASAIKDSTVNGNHATDVGTPPLGSTGRIDGAVGFNGTTQHVRVENEPPFDLTTAMTVSAWVRSATGAPTGFEGIVAKDNATWRLQRSGTNPYLAFDTDTSQGGKYAWGAPNVTNDGLFHYAVGTFDGRAVRLFVDGTLAPNSQTCSPACTLNTDNTQVSFGAKLPTVGEWNGVIDEVRISKTPRSQCWIETEYKNQGTPGTFSTLGAPTAVALASFVARGVVSGVELSWQTGSELTNLGFHLHRAVAEAGPYERITTSLIAGLGSSPVGASYAYLDTGLVPGQRYFYRLEDVDASSVSTFHGPVSALVGVTSPPPPGEGGGGEPGDGSGASSGSCPPWVVSANGASASTPLTCTKHGDPDSVSLAVLSRDSRQAVLELRTGGFWALHDVIPRDSGLPGPEGSGGVRVYVRGFDTPLDSKALALPLRRALVDAVVGKQVRLASVEGLDLARFPGLRPSAVGLMEMGVSRDGTVRPVRRPVRAPVLSRDLSPPQLARLVGTVFQGERKSAVVELVPVRYDGVRGDLVLARRVRVRLAFAGQAPGETGSGRRGRLQRRRPRPEEDVLAQLHTTLLGLHGVRFEDVFPGRQRPLETSFLRLQRQGEAVSFHVEPAGGTFGPGSVLYFHAERTAASTDFTGEVSYELVRSPQGGKMEVVLARPRGPAVVTPSSGQALFETNRFYQSGLLEAPDVWLWEGLVSGASRTKTFTLAGVDAGSGVSGRVVVSLQGGSESGTVVDHHVSASVNGVFAGEVHFSGKRPYRMELAVPASVLREGENEITVVNAGDTGVSSLVFLDRFTVDYPQGSEARAGVFEGEWAQGGTAQVGGLNGPAAVLDVTVGDIARNAAGPSAVKWLSGVEALAGSMRFQAEAGHRYLVVAGEGVLSPRVVRPAASTLRSAENQADYLLIAPQSFLGAAEPLLARRASQGLTVKAVSLEEIATVFGHGQPSGEAIRSFVSHAYQSWAKPSPRYVVLFGDATSDPQHFLSTSSASPLPTLWGKTSFLWTAMDPQIGAVNGEDELPDLAVGRIPATTVEQAESLVAKLLAWEDSAGGLEGKVALVADNPDEAGDFEADVADIQASFLGNRETTVLKVGELGAGTRPAIQEAFDQGLSLLSYVGHGGSAVWASENVWNSWDAPSLRAQSRQPLLLTMNCLNGYFVAPNFESLSESLLKEEGRGAIAAFSPSGLSVDGPAHQYHRAVVEELTSGKHERLGDAILAAQKTYAETGLMPELLSVYHLLGDPAMKIR